MRYEWDPEKDRSNARKPGVMFGDAISVFGDDRALTIEEPHPDEERYVTIGIDAFGRVLLVVYTWRSEDAVRLISARKATPREREQYTQGEP
jgi:uncharacterized protein